MAFCCTCEFTLSTEKKFLDFHRFFSEKIRRLLAGFRTEVIFLMGGFFSEILNFSNSFRTNFLGICILKRVIYIKCCYDYVSNIS